MKSILIFLLFNLALLSHAQTSLDSINLNQIIRDEIIAWNKGDGEGYSKHFSKNGTFTNIFGWSYVGYDEFLFRHNQIFKTIFFNTELTQDVVSIKFLSPEVAIVETITLVSGLKSPLPYFESITYEEGKLKTHLLQVFNKVNGIWKIETYHNVLIQKKI